MRTIARAFVRTLAVLVLPFALVAIAGSALRGRVWLALALSVGLLLAACAISAVRTWRAALRQTVGNGALVFGILVLIGLAVGPKLSLYRTVTVLSGSMRPTFDPGDVILVTPEPTRDLRLGQIITYQIPTGAKQVESHRVVRILRHGNTPIVQTRGDANTGLDPWQAELHGGTLWRFRFRIPLLGYPILALRTHIAHLLLVIVFPILFALYALAEVWRPRDRPRMAHAQQTR